MFKVLSFLAVAMTVSSQAALLAYYDFNSESGGLVSDLSGNGQTGNLNGVGTTTLTADGSGYSGNTGDRGLSYSSTNLATDLNYFVATSTQSPGTGDFSLSFWYSTIETGTHALADHAQVPNTTRGYQILGTAAGGQAAIFGSSALATSSGSVVPTIGDGNYHHFVMSVDRTNELATTYLDNTSTGTFSTTGIGSVDLGELHLGAFNDGQVLSAGLLDDYAIFDSVLSVTQVESLFNGASPTVVPEPSSIFFLSLAGLGLFRRRH